MASCTRRYTHLFGQAIFCGAVAFTSPALSQPAAAPICPGPDMKAARATAPIGKLNHRANSRGTLIWTTQCGPNTPAKGDDPVCKSITACSSSGAFGRFIRSVSGNCQAKRFTDFFGLDGLTYGILHWTATELPNTFSIYRARHPVDYDRAFGSAALSFRANGCLDPSWVAERNRQGEFLCKAPLAGAFRAATQSRAFQKAQLEQAFGAYERRILIGFRTEYGAIAMITIMNNLKSTPNCKAAALVRACASISDERLRTDCVLNRYQKFQCRGGNPTAAAERAAEIRSAFKGAPTSTNLHPKLSDVEQCVSSWRE